MSRPAPSKPFHAALVGGIAFQAVLAAQGPSILVEGGTPIPLARGSALADKGGGWSIVGRESGEVLLRLEGFGGREIGDLCREFGLTRLHDGGARPDQAFHESRAWAGLTKWVSRNVGQAAQRAPDDAALPGWHAQALVALDARSNPANFDETAGGMRMR